ncbi:hypothetical protein [Roseisalinus antarcticus]|uniref:Uncharacterized protein n=1 Tax=Roseisalinus antarcticus TaxID=254357 RepID=A0A1Y5RSW0_9RHOB|nr:hypothetical protein [Roseisalinus antarcticus]SLN23554.1 hypothetical protein ROA7023_00708 [Roseisalinus antarcticus]
MGNKWILDVLADLGAFAEANDMPRLADQIELASIVAAAEIVSRTEFGAPGRVYGDSGDFGINFGELASRRSA